MINVLFPDNAMQWIIQSDIIYHSYMFLLHHAWLPMEFNKELWRAAHLFIQQFLATTIVIVANVYINLQHFQALQGAVTEIFICDILKNVPLSVI